jgi:hypothetical protein
LEANLFIPNPVGKKYSIKTGIIEYSIKTVARDESCQYTTSISSDSPPTEKKLVEVGV